MAIINIDVEERKTIIKHIIFILADVQACEGNWEEYKQLEKDLDFLNKLLDELN